MIELGFNSDKKAFDLSLLTSGGLKATDSLQTAVLISLFTDRRAGPDDVLPEDAGVQSLLPPDRRGWCGDALPETPGDKIGSRLWLLARAKQTEETRRRAIFYAEEALAWLIEDGLALAVTVTAEWVEYQYLRMRVDVQRTAGDWLTVYTPTGVAGGSAYAV